MLLEVVFKIVEKLIHLFGDNPSPCGPDRLTLFGNKKIEKNIERPSWWYTPLYDALF